MSPPAGFAIHTHNPAFAAVETKPAKSTASPQHIFNIHISHHLHPWVLYTINLFDA